MGRCIASLHALLLPGPLRKSNNCTEEHGSTRQSNVSHILRWSYCTCAVARRGTLGLAFRPVEVQNCESNSGGEEALCLLSNPLNDRSICFLLLLFLFYISNYLGYFQIDTGSLPALPKIRDGLPEISRFFFHALISCRCAEIPSSFTETTTHLQRYKGTHVK